MRKRTKILLRLWINRILVFMALSLIVWANVIRLQDNSFSNYEKAVDYGRVREDDAPVNPIIAAIFYEGKNKNTGLVSSYFNHAENYKRTNIKIIVAPKKITEYSREVVEKLYSEISKHNKIKKIALVYAYGSDVFLHHRMLQRTMKTDKIKDILVSEDNILAEKALDKYFSQKESMVVFLADLDNGLNQKNGDFLVGEAIYFAQKYFYQMNVFDVVDTQLAKALDRDYEALYPIDYVKHESVFEKQKTNLERYKKHYWPTLSGYFELNILQLLNGGEIIMPSKNEENYRLYDRGCIVVKAMDENYIEIAEKAELHKNEAIVSSFINVVKYFVSTGVADKAKYYKVYLLTDMEYIERRGDALLMSYLDYDDGVYAEYNDKSAILVADDRPDNPEDLSKIVRKKAKISEDVADSDIKYYKFKTVEMKYGD